MPQNIYLTDDTIAANIAFGAEKENIDRDAVIRASKIANLHDFVQSDLPEAYETRVGERGARLSGGQRQRIGIARALYHSPSILVLDEATSALDNITERHVMDGVKNLDSKVTTIIIAHRLSTVKNCDVVYLMKSGEVADCGTFKDLHDRNEFFREMSQTSEDF